MPVVAATTAHARGHNCCQAILHAFQERCLVDDGRIAAASRAGAGRAPGGRCGALHAALELVEVEQQPGLEAAFVAFAGAAACREIRRLRRVSCNACVGEAARLVAERLRQGAA